MTICSNSATLGTAIAAIWQHWVRDLGKGEVEREQRENRRCDGE